VQLNVVVVQMHGTDWKAIYKSYKEYTQAQLSDVRVVRSWVHEGKKCVVLRGQTHYAAYVEAKYRIDYDDGFGPANFIESHGGITFSGTLVNNPFGADVWFYGMDFGHLGDHVEFPNGGCISCKAGSRHNWTEEEVVRETEKLVDEVRRFEEMYFLRVLKESFS